MKLENFSKLVKDVEIAIETLKEVKDQTITMRGAIVEGAKFLTSLKTLEATDLKVEAIEVDTDKEDED